MPPDSPESPDNCTPLRFKSHYNMENTTDFVEIFAGQHLEVELVRTLLEASGIEAFVFDSCIGTIAPWYAAAGGAGAVRLMVAPADAEEAHVLIKEFDKNRNA